MPWNLTASSRCESRLMATIIFSFLLLLITHLAAAFEGDDDIGQLTDFFQFRTRPDLLAPRWNVTTHDEQTLAPGYWFVTPYIDNGSLARGEAWLGPHIYDQIGELVWSGVPLFDHYKAYDLRIAQIGGIDMLTTIHPYNNSVAIIDKNYGNIRNIVISGNRNHTNFHDFNIVEDGTRAVSLTRDENTVLSTDKTKAIGLDVECVVRGDGMKFLDITTSPPQILFSWNASDHLGLEETVFTGNRSELETLCSGEAFWSVHHMNSIDIFPDGDFLISARNTATLYKISRQDDGIVWRLGGKKSDFYLPREAQFQFQNHGRIHVQNETHIVISLLDNDEGGPEDDNSARTHSAGLILALNTRTMTGELVGEYPYPHKAHTWKRGSAQILPNDNVFMGWAQGMHVSEHASDGRILMEAHALPRLGTYRAYKYEWIGQPLTSPNVYSAAFLHGTNVSTFVYVSWNGATEVAKWDLYELVGRRPSTHLIDSRLRTGFETARNYDGYAPCIYVAAVDSDDNIIGKSLPVCTIPAVESDPNRTESGRICSICENLKESAQGNSGTDVLIFLLGFASCVLVLGAAWLFELAKKWMGWERTERVQYEAIPLDDYE